MTIHFPPAEERAILRHQRTQRPPSTQASPPVDIAPWALTLAGQIQRLARLEPTAKIVMQTFVVERLAQHGQDVAITDDYLSVRRVPRGRWRVDGAHLPALRRSPPRTAISLYVLQQTHGGRISPETRTCNTLCHEVRVSSHIVSTADA